MAASCVKLSPLDNLYPSFNGFTLKISALMLTFNEKKRKGNGTPPNISKVRNSLMVNWKWWWWVFMNYIISFLSIQKKVLSIEIFRYYFSYDFYDKYITTILDAWVFGFSFHFYNFTLKQRNMTSSFEYFFMLILRLYTDFQHYTIIHILLS